MKLNFILKIPLKFLLALVLDFVLPSLNHITVSKYQSKSLRSTQVIFEISGQIPHILEIPKEMR